MEAMEWSDFGITGVSDDIEKKIGVSYASDIHRKINANGILCWNRQTMPGDHFNQR